MPERNPVVISDLEGPIVCNDTAREICGYFIEPDGEQFFDKISEYDDYRFLKNDGIPGTSLQMVYPFLKAFEAGDEEVEDYARSHMRYVPGARSGINCLPRGIPFFVVTSAYQPFALAAAEELGIPSGHIYCTGFEMDNYELAEKERKKNPEVQGENLGIARHDARS